MPEGSPTPPGAGPSGTNPAGTSPDLKKQVEGLVAECIEAMERGEADPVMRVCAGRPDLLARVQRRLGQLALRGLIPGTEAGAPQTIGPYRVLRELGSGGMGAVYLAQQSAPVQRQVALKVIKLGMDTREVVSRFHAERQVLARMSHPNIAQVFDAGSTDDGRPYFVMEYVAGQPLVAFCNEHRLGVDERLRVFATICRAVQHAHDRGVIHRDLKPTNMLVTAQDGQVVAKVIDFGIAKAASADLLSDVNTRHDQVLGTPEYMSPEQARSGGLEVDTRSDVYSLGVVLYELLCGELPFDSRRLRRAGRRELERILTEELPTSPSTRLQMAAPAVVDRFGSDSTGLRRRVRGELDWIALKALSKEPSMRYPSALALAEDIERHLRDEPVQAVPPGAGYRLRKFVQRHRVPVAAAAVVFLALVVGLLVSMHATSVARAAQQQEAMALADMRAFYGLARDAVSNLVEVADEPLSSVPQADAVRRRMLADALRFYDGLQQRQPSDAGLQLDIAGAKDKAGVLQRRLGAPLDAIATLTDCIDKAEALHRQHPERPQALKLQVLARSHLAQALTAVGRGAEARSCLEAALGNLDGVRALSGADADLDKLEAVLNANLGIESEDLERALECFARSVAAWDRAIDRAPGDALLRIEAARCLALRADSLTRLNRLEDAAATLDQAVARLQAVPAPAPTDVRAQLALSWWQRAAVLRRLDRMAEGVAAATEAVARFAQLAADHPDVTSYADQQAEGLEYLAEAALARGELATAVQNYEQIVALRRTLADRNPQSHQLRVGLVRAFIDHASALKDVARQEDGSLTASLAVMEQAVQVGDALQAAGAQDIEVGLAFAAAREGRAALRDAMQQPREAMADHEAAHKVLAALAVQSPKAADVRSLLAFVDNNLTLAHLQAGDVTAAVAAGEAALAEARAVLAIDARHRQIRQALPQIAIRLASAQQRAGDLEAAIVTLSVLFELDVGQQGRETGAMVMGQFGLTIQDAERRREVLARVETELRRALAARGARHDVRELEVRLLLANLHEAAGAVAEQEAEVKTVIELLASLPKVPPDRVRNLFTMAAELALARGDTETAAAHAQAMLDRLGPGGGANYLAAVLLSRCAAVGSEAVRESYCTRAVACLSAALERKEVRASALQHENFDPVRERDDFKALSGR